MTTLFGESANYLLFTDGDNAVVIDKTMNMVENIGHLAVLSSAQPWRKNDISAEKVHYELASGALADLRVQVVVASGRMYTIPKAAQEEAKKALEWRKEHHRGGTPVGLNSARILAEGGQIGIKKVRHIAKYFPRHEVDKKGKGWKPGEDGFPSNGRIAWALWGGDAAWRWARAIVESENKKALKADLFVSSSEKDVDDNYRMAASYDANIDAFRAAEELGEEYGPEFVVRTRLDASGIDRLYMINSDGHAFVWDDGDWDDLGHVDGDIMSYDRSLDHEEDDVDKHHVFVDPDTALIVSAHLQQKPFTPVTVNDINEEEADLIASAIDEIDWTIVDAAMIAAGEEAPAPATPSTDGEYTPKERAANARRQVRDKTGKFASQGSRVVVGGDASKTGSITRVNPNSQTVNVKLDSGEEIEVPGSDTQKAEDFDQQTGPLYGEMPSPLDTSGILGQPRAPIDRPGAYLPGGLPALTSDQLRQVIGDYPAWVKSQRDNQQAQQTVSKKPITDYAKARSDFVKGLEQRSGVKIDENLGDLRQHPLYKNLFKTKPIYNLYYNPMLSAAEASAAASPATSQGAAGKPIDPDTSDVQPLYMAIVSPEDPRAVFDLVAIVPASTTSTSPMTYKRENAKWVKDEQILADLTSPTPPPVVPLHGDDLLDTLTQIDKGVTAAGYDEFAQGGLDKNRGKAEKLRRYWVYGRGAAKIRWGTPGDWKRCVRHLSKYMGPRAKGYCNLRHKDALHIWPATHAKILRGGRKKGNFSNEEFIMEEPVYGFDFDKMAKDKNYTEIAKEDLDKDLDEILAENDSLYDSEWEPDDHIVTLISELHHDYESYEGEPLIAVGEGGLDRNRGNAEKLRHYWLYGRGALKIRWNTPGDWTRCYRHLRKYMGLRAKGYCSLRHKEATGVWPGSKYNIGKKNVRGSAFEEITIASEEDILNLLYERASYTNARERVLLAGAGGEGSGCGFVIPLVIPEDKESGDGRKFKKNSIEIRELPLPLLWQIRTADGHDGSVVVGRIDKMVRTENGIGNAYGVFDTSAYGREAERMVRDGFIRGVSADLDQFEASEEDANEAAKKDEKKIGGGKISINHARVMAVTIVPKPAFEECRIYLDENTNAGESQEEDMNKMPDGIYVEDMEDVDAQAIVACGMIAGSIPTTPPASWFSDPKLDGPTPLTVDDNGRVFGHIAAWHVNHIGMMPGTRPPRSKSKYAYFHTGVLRADDGKDYPVGQLTLAGGHASLEASAVDAAKHYDDTGSAIADVHAGEDRHGIWVAGALRPSATPEQIRALRASAPSGDWRPISGALELVAVCQVNVPGFPIARARVASGQVYALVAAGAQVLAKMKNDPITELSNRIAALESATLSAADSEKAELIAKADEARAKFAALKQAEAQITDEQKVQKVEINPEELRARVASAQALAEFAQISDKVRQRLAKEGKALPDGSYPIRNVSDLKNAIHAYGRSTPADRAKVRAHIKKRAKALGKADMIPENWTSASAIEEDVVSLRAQIASAQEKLNSGE